MKMVDWRVNELLAEMDLRHNSSWRWRFVVWILGSCSTLMSWKKGAKHLLIRMRVLMTFFITCACPGILFNNMSHFTLLEFEELCALVYPTLASTARSTGQEEAPATQRETPKGRPWRLFKLKFQATWSVRSALFLQGPNSSQSIVRRCSISGTRMLWNFVQHRVRVLQVRQRVFIRHDDEVKTPKKFRKTIGFPAIDNGHQRLSEFIITGCHPVKLLVLLAIKLHSLQQCLPHSEKSDKQSHDRVACLTAPIRRQHQAWSWNFIWWFKLMQLVISCDKSVHAIDLLHHNKIRIKLWASTQQSHVTVPKTRAKRRKETDRKKTWWFIGACKGTRSGD